jgi:hypothetical protein
MPLSKIVANSITDDTITTDQIADTSVHGRRNLVINGAMRVNQRNATTTATGYTLDRFRIIKSAAFDELVIAVTQDTDNPSGNGFANSLKLAVTTAESAIASDELMYLQHGLEGQDIHHVAYGTSSAKSLTLSFWVKSPLAGKHAVTFYQQTPARSNLQSYTVSSANTWEHKTITIDGDTSGNIVNDNSHEFTIFWPLAGGSDYHGTPHTGWGAYSATDDFMFSDQVNLAGQTGNFYLTGVQLEVGEQASPFEHRGVGEELELCQRYFYRRDITIYDVAAMGHVLSTNRGAYLLHTPTAMRAKPSVSQGSNIHCWYTSGGSVTSQSNLVAVYMDNDTTDFNQVYIMADANSSLASVGHPLALTSYHSSGTADSHVSLDAEL